MKFRMKFVTALLCAGCISGCSSTGVIPVDGDSYMIGKKDGSPGLGVSFANKAAVYREANEFCQARSRVVKTLQENTTPARPGQLGSTELQFRCVPPGTPGEAVPGKPDEVREIRLR